MPARLFNLVAIPPLAPAASATLPHGLHDDGGALRPDIAAFIGAGGFTLTALGADMTVTNAGAAPTPGCSAFVWRIHSIDRALEGDADLAPQPVVIAQAGESVGSGPTIDFILSVNLNDDAQTSAFPVPEVVGSNPGPNPMVLAFVTTKPNQHVEVRAALSGTNNSAPTEGFALSLGLDGADAEGAFGSCSSGPVSGTSGSAPLLKNFVIPIPGPHSIDLRWKTLGGGTAHCNAATNRPFESANLSVWGYTP